MTDFDPKLLEFVDKDIQIKFFEKFGHKIISVHFDTQFKSFLNSLPNIEELKDCSQTNNSADIQLKRLKRLSVYLYLDMDLTQFNVFIERNSKTITHLNINCISSYENSNKEQSMVGFKQMLTIVSNLKSLVHLKIRSRFAINHNSFKEQLTQMAVNCNQLKGLSINYELELIDGQNSDQFLALKQFKGLKRLQLNFVNESNSLSNYLSNNGFFPFITLSKVVPHLTHIYFHIIRYLYNNQKLSKTIFTDIDINYPKLQSICIGNKVNVSEETVLMMSRMTRLESIHLYLSKKQNKREISSQLAKNCIKLRKINF